MKKNVASQVIGAQMVNASDGSAFTGSATVVITVDGGTQSASGGTGPTHEGNGFHSYIPTQAETNGDHVAFTFTGTGAIPVTVQVYTTFPQTGDSFVRLGAPAGASVSADIATVDGNVDSILADTGTDGVIVATNNDKTGYALSAAGVDAILDEALSGHATAGTLGKAITDIETDVAAILVDTAEIGTAGAGLTNINLPDQTMNITGNITGNLSGSVGSVLGGINTAAGTITTLDGLDTAQDAQHSQTQSDIAALNDPTAASIADAVWDEAKSGHTTAGTFGTAFNLQLEGTASGTPTTTTMVSDIGVTVDDQFKGRTIIFDEDTTTAALRNQATDITACTAATNTLTFTALTTAPSSGDKFHII